MAGSIPGGFGLKIIYSKASGRRPEELWFETPVIRNKQGDYIWKHYKDVAMIKRIERKTNK